MHTKRKRFGLMMCAALAVLAAGATTVEATGPGAGPGSGGQKYVGGHAYIDYYINGIPSNTTTLEFVWVGLNTPTCSQQIQTLKNQAIVYNGSTSYRKYMVQGFACWDVMNDDPGTGS